MRRRTAACVFFLLIMATAAQTKTRWSSLHLTPDADFLSGGQFVVDGQGYFYVDSAKGPVITPTVLADIGIIEWVNVELGYAGGLTLGFKARIIGETGGFMPSLAIGARNIFSSKEAHYFGSKDTMENQFYCALSKSVDALRLRLHLGIQSIPASKKDQADPFLTLEEYFGNGLYATAEIERLKGGFWPSVFISWRILKKRLEISGGAVGVNRLLFDKNNKFGFSLSSNDSMASMAFVKPGLWFGIRYCGVVSFAKNNFFMSVDDKVAQQQNTLEIMRGQIDSLKSSFSENQVRMAKTDNSLLMLSDSVYSDKNRFRAALYDKLIALKTMYETEPFDPDQVRQLIRRITALKESTIPALKEFIIDKKQDRRVRLLSISLLGEMGVAGASDVLLDVLSQSEDPEIKIEILIALGKIKETRAIYVMEQLANDPIDVVAFTAQEILMKLVREKGIRLSSDFKMRRVAMPESSVMKEEKLPVQRSKAAAMEKPKDTVRAAPPAVGDTAKPVTRDTVRRAADDVWEMQGSKGAQGAQGADSSQASVKQSKTVSKDALDTLAAGAVKKNNEMKLPADSSAKPDTLRGATIPDAQHDAASKKKGKSAKKKNEPKSKTPPADEKNW